MTGSFSGAIFKEGRGDVASHCSGGTYTFQRVAYGSHSLSLNTRNHKYMNKKTFLLSIIVSGLIIFGAFGYFLFTEQKPDSLPKGWLTYENKELGISFNYPPNFKIYQPDRDHLRIDSDYKNPRNNIIRLSLNIKKLHPDRQTFEESGIRPDPSDFLVTLPEELKNRKYTVQRKENYDLVRVENSRRFHYILSDRGTFSISSTMNIEAFKSQLEEEGVYQDYRTTFDQIISTIKIID
ncbi:hypothetical protein MYX75_05570 [Acidobacteria bacterium AH-259-A15]|nr:hypothetical protein [Acidobacteria bacterium AH-259-A15]